jgi:hypothetical protein
MLSRLRLSTCHRKHVLFKGATYGDVAISIFLSTSHTSWFRLSDTNLHPPISSSAHTAPALPVCGGGSQKRCKWCQYSNHSYLHWTVSFQLVQSLISCRLLSTQLNLCNGEGHNVALNNWPLKILEFVYVFSGESWGWHLVLWFPNMCHGIN